MNYRSILVHLDASPRCDLRVGLAASIASSQGAHLLGLAPTGVATLPASMRSQAAAMESVRAEFTARAQACVQRFNEQVSTLGLPSHEGRVHGDDTLSAVLQHARSCDLVVLGQHEPGLATPLVPWDLPQQVFLHAGRPTLVVPYAGDFTTIGQRTVVAWTDSRETARAMADALPLLQRAGRVDLLAFNAGDTAAFSAADAWLQRHGVQARLYLETTELDVGDALLSRTFDLDADLLVMGGYGRSRVAEMVVGGVTRKVLQQMTLPVLLSH